MDMLILLALVILLFMIVLPIISLVKLSAIDNRIRDLELELKKALNPRLSKEKRPEETEIIPDDEPQAEAVEVQLSVEATVQELPAVGPVAEPGVAEEPRPVYSALETTIEEQTIACAELPDADKPEQELEPKPQMTLKEITASARTASQKAPKKNIPAIRFENLLSKIGIVTLVLGIAFFVKYAIDKEWINEVGRVAIGVLTGAVLICIAHRLRKSYNVFSALMVGGGISVFYITITLAFREYQLFSQTVAFVILIAITVFSVILSLIYDRKELALFSLLGGYASPLMISTGADNYVVLFSFLLLLNSGMLVIAMRKRWRIIGVVSFVCSLAFFWGWLLKSFDAQYAGALTFAALFFAQFYLLALFDHFRSQKKISVYQAAVILANNLSMFAAAVYIFNDSTLKIAGLITICMAVVNAFVMGVLFRKTSVDKRLLYLVIAIVLSFISLAVPVQLDGHVITMFWAAEAVILLWLWRKSEIRLFHIGFWLITALTLGAYFMDAGQNYFQSHENLPVIFNRMFITGLVVIASLAVSRFLLGRISGAGVRAGRNILGWSIVLFCYVVPFLEINYQFGAGGLYRFSYTMLTVYTTIYMAVLAFVFRGRLLQTHWMYVALCVFVVLYLVPGQLAMIILREHTFVWNDHPHLFALHYLALPALVYLFYLLAKGTTAYTKSASAVLGWSLVTAAVIILSVELENTVVQFWGNAENYHALLHDVRTIGYPILWGFLAMMLMVWGLKARKALLRQISLGFFALIILKFYVNDIWLMSQAGRIVSFVILGVILLTVSFLIQKIKVLVKDDAPAEEPQND
ncbi:DUF2339 domain-containing protein [uncultured Alistipes sp.]|uniref:DUF2339 domain-containing protein n=1 Tax=uncultured Alistipes sp. TaxID=538949 RepID=UPI0025ED1A01|nr:DUF2339 domain-containing protein [uncultured Alistipes sp.]